MSKYGFNPKELRKTIITQIDKDGFHNRTVTYGKDSGGSQSSDWPTAKLTFADSNASGVGYFASCPIVADTGFPEISVLFAHITRLLVARADCRHRIANNHFKKTTNDKL